MVQQGLGPCFVAPVIVARDEPVVAPEQVDSRPVQWVGSDALEQGDAGTAAGQDDVRDASFGDRGGDRRGRLRSPAAATRASVSGKVSTVTSGVPCSVPGGRVDHLVDAGQGFVVDLVGVQAAQILGQAFAGFPARQRKLGVGAPGPAQGGGGPVLRGRSARWSTLLLEFDLQRPGLPAHRAVDACRQPAGQDVQRGSLASPTPARR